jgi:hypothetical protein
MQKLYDGAFVLYFFGATWRFCYKSTLDKSMVDGTCLHAEASAPEAWLTEL